MRKLLLVLSALSIVLSYFAIAMPVNVVAMSSPAITATTACRSDIGCETVIATCGEGFLEERGGINVLHVKGTPYEMGYQHGVLMADEILEQYSICITYESLVRGSGDFPAGFAYFIAASQIIEPYIPQEYRDELVGLADGLAARGSPLTYEDVLIWNTYMTSSRIFSCNSFSAWGDATADGKMIVGKNLDWYSFTEVQNPTVMITDPDNGYALIRPMRPGIIGCIDGMSESGLVFTSHLGAVQCGPKLEGIPSTFLDREILQYADSIAGAMAIINSHSRCVGSTYHIIDGKTNEAAVIQDTGCDLTVCSGDPNWDALWATAGYFGDCAGNSGWFIDNYGQITVDVGIERMRELCVLTPPQTVYQDVTYYKSGVTGSITKQLYTCWSMVAVPGDGIIRIAIGTIPACDGPYVYFDLQEELSRDCGETVPTPAPTPTPTVTPIPPVGGTSLPTDKLNLIMPWIAGAAVIIFTALWVTFCTSKRGRLHQ